MSARSPQAILDGVVQRKGKGATMRRKLAANQDRNWLLALTLHAFAKSANKGKLTDLERAIVTAFRDNGFTEAEIKQHGKVTEALPDVVRAELFPARFAQLAHGKDAYSFADLKKDAPAITKSFLAMPNTVNLDVEAIHAGKASVREFRPERSVIREAGSEALMAIEPSTSLATRGRFTIKATKFKCHDRAGDAVFGPSNEPYWIFGSTDGDVAKATRSRVFGDVDSGETRTFAASDGLLWGLNGAAQELPDGQLGVLVSLWEHDGGDPKKVQAEVGAAFALTVKILAITGVAAWVGVVVAAVGAVVVWLLGFMDDDHIADQTLAFSRAVIEKHVPKVGGSMVMTRRFEDGDADYFLNITITRVG